jgi:hypothetical protein
MNLVLKRRLAVLAAALAAAGGTAGTALACDHDGFAAARMTLSAEHHHAFVHRDFLGGTISGYLGLTRAQILADLRSGQTLAQIADAIPGKSAAGLVEAIVAPWRAKLDAAVAAGKLSAGTESTILAHLNAKVTAFVNGSWHWWWWHR